MLSSSAASDLNAAWRAASLRLLVIAGVLAFGFHETWAAMFRVWMQSETYGHGLVVAPISAWLIWRIRDQWLALQPRVSWAGLPIVALGSAAWLVAELARVNVVAQYGLLVILWGLTGLALGTAVVRTLIFPLAFLFFMVPAGDALNAPLMEATATATITALRAVGLPVFREGMLFTLPTGQWSVIEACSGLRYVLAAAMLGALFSWLNFRSWRLRLAFFVAAIVLALVGNWARAWLVVMIGHLSNMRYGTGDDHVWYGWVFFGLVMGGLFWMGGRWKEDALDSTDTKSAELEPARFELSSSQEGARLVWLATLVAVAAVPVFEQHITQVTPRSGLQAQFEAIVGQGGDTHLEAPPQIGGAREMVMTRYPDPASGSLVGLEVTSAYFADQTVGHEMIAWSNSAAPDRQRHGWTVLRSERHIGGAGGQHHPVQEMLLARGAQRRLMWSWYIVSGDTSASELGGKFLTAWALIRGLGDHSCMHVLSLPVDAQGAVASDSPSLVHARRVMAEMAQKLPCV